jgi:hypothetical protein
MIVPYKADRGQYSFPFAGEGDLPQHYAQSIVGHKVLLTGIRESFTLIESYLLFGLLSSWKASPFRPHDTVPHRKADLTDSSLSLMRINVCRPCLNRFFPDSHDKIDTSKTHLKSVNTEERKWMSC